MTLREVVHDYLANSSLHGVKFIVDKHNTLGERIFWALCVIMSWVASGLLMRSSWDAFQTNAISFVVETSYRDWDTDFPAIVVCEFKNVDRLQELADRLWGEHDFTLEEVLSEVVFFRGESYHTIEECGDQPDNEQCIHGNFTHFARLGRSTCNQTISQCQWNGRPFDCCAYFEPMATELGVCFALNSAQVTDSKVPKLNMISNKYTGLGQLKMEVLTEANVYTLGAEDVPNLVASKSEFFTVGPFIAYRRQISVRNIENDAQTRSVSVAQRSCRFRDENWLDVHRYYSYSACSVQCRKDRQLAVCNCTSHLMPGTTERQHCDMNGLRCLNDNYEELSVVIASWSHDRTGLVCDCLPSCTELDVSVVHDSRMPLEESATAADGAEPRALSTVEIGLVALPTERYKRNVVRGTLDLVVSMGGTTGLFIGASLLSFVELLYYFTVRPYGTMVMRRRVAELGPALAKGDN